MTAEKLREIFGRIDDEFIEEAETYVPRKRSSKPIWIITSASAAVIAVISCVNLFNTFGNDHRPEISNYAVTTTVTDSRTDELVTEEGKIPEKTERSAETTVSGSASDAVDVNTEVTETAFGYESSIQNAATVPEKTEAPSGNGGSSGEKTVPDKHPQEVTEVTPAEITDTEQTSADQTLNPVTEPTIYPQVDSTKGPPVYVETVPSSTWYPSPIPTPSPCENPTPIPTPSPCSTPASSYSPLPPVTSFPDVTTADITDIPVSQKYGYKISDFPAVLKTSDGVKYERKLLITKGQAGKFIKTISLSDDYGNDYEISEYSLRYEVSGYPLKGVSDEQVSIFYFESENEYLIYVNETENES